MGVNLPNELMKSVQATFGISENFIVPKANDTIPLALDHRATRCISGFGVLTTIEFDNHFKAMAREIGDVVAKGNLSSPSAVR